MPGLYATAFPPEGEVVSWRADEVLLDLFGEPHLLLRLTITGPLFPHRALEPVVHIGDTRSKFVRISEDGLRAEAYFDSEPAGEGDIRFGHGPNVELVVPDAFDPRRIKHLDRNRLPDHVRIGDASAEPAGGHASAAGDTGEARRA